ncbi:MAG: hypothetical protein C4336_08985 [Armatimonadota bacterium]
MAKTECVQQGVLKHIVGCVWIAHACFQQGTEHLIPIAQPQAVKRFGIPLLRAFEKDRIVRHDTYF